MRRSRTYIATPPGVTIKEQLNDRGMNQKEFAARMDLSEKHISKLINGDVILTQEVAMRLEMVLGLPAHFWNNLESIYREKLLLVQEENDMDADIEIASKFPYKEMEKNGWVPSANKPMDRIISLRKFFEIVRLTMLQGPLIPGIAYRRQAITEKANYALLAWAQKAKLEARAITTKTIDIEQLKHYIPIIRKMTKQNPEVFCPELCKMLANCGIALVFLPHIDGSFLHGASFYDKNKIVIGLTVRGKDADKFWFSLFHELGHVIYGHINNENGTTEQEEKDADDFASNTLIPKIKFESFISKNRFTTKSIQEFANENDIDIGIVVGRLQKEGYINYNRFNNLKTKYELQA
ncbi:MAG: helix-turn-helix domain-containing protein [Firmicutes bacterium]|nr:helix-turn-helix domain-containing protein [Bacillota bacterium]